MLARTVSFVLQSAVEVVEFLRSDQDEDEPQLLHVHCVDAERLKLHCIVCVVGAEYCGRAGDLQPLCRARSPVFVTDSERHVFVFPECAEFQPALGEDGEFPRTVFVGERGAADKVAACSGEGTGRMRMNEVLDCGAEFVFGHADCVLVLLRPVRSSLIVVHRGSFACSNIEAGRLPIQGNL